MTDNYDWPAWVRSWPCIDPNCDGKGTVCLGAHEHENGEIEYDIQQCRFCDERERCADELERLQRIIAGHETTIIEESIAVQRLQSSNAELLAENTELMSLIIDARDDCEWSSEDFFQKINSAITRFERKKAAAEGGDHEQTKR